MVSKLDQVLEKVTDTQIKMARVEEHLRALNGNVQRNKGIIDKNTHSIYQVKKRLAYFSGGLTAIVGLFVILGIKLQNYIS